MSQYRLYICSLRLDTKRGLPTNCPKPLVSFGDFATILKRGKEKRQ